MEHEQTKNKKGSLKVKLLISLIIFLILALISAVVYFEYILFKTKAEGIALGYTKAVLSSYQAQRPLSDNIFEEGNYRVEAKSRYSSQTQVLINISVRDKYTNISHYEHQDTFGIPTTPTNMPVVPSNNTVLPDANNNNHPK